MVTPTFKTRPMQVTEARLGRPLEEVLRELYVDRGMTQKQVGVELGVDASTVNRWMRELGIEARFPGQKAEAVA